MDYVAFFLFHVVFSKLYVLLIAYLYFVSYREENFVAVCTLVCLGFSSLTFSMCRNPKFDSDSLAIVIHSNFRLSSMAFPLFS